MLEYLIPDNFIESGERVAVGVSGGADSMVLLWALFDKQKKTDFYLEVININHHLRGKDSDDDSLFVKNFCEKHKIPVKVVDVDVKKLKTDKKYTLEESARIARYDAFKSVMKQDKLSKLFLAHHKNDQAETILMHIFRGSGISGAVGIKNSGYIFRPLLSLQKTEILKIAKESGIDFVEDKSNSDNTYSRNFIRNVLLPQIEKTYPGVVDSICSFGKRCEEVQNYIESLVDENLIEFKENSVVLREQVFKLENFIGREYLKRAFEHLGVFSDIESKHIALIFELNLAEANKEISLPHNLIAKKTYSGIKILKNKEEKVENLEFEFLKNGEIVFGNYCKIKTEVVSSSDVVYGEALYIDASKVSTNAIWRTRRLGDKFSKIGTGSKKLNDYFTNLKLDFEIRDKIPLLANGENILVVVGDDVSENVKIDSNTDEIVRITYELI